MDKDKCFAAEARHKHDKSNKIKCYNENYQPNWCYICKGDNPKHEINGCEISIGSVKINLKPSL